MEKQRPVDDFAVFQLLQPDPGDAAFTPQNDAVQLLFSHAARTESISRKKPSFQMGFSW